MNGCPAKATIQQLACGKNNFESIFALTFQGKMKHKNMIERQEDLLIPKKLKFILSFKAT